MKATAIDFQRTRKVIFWLFLIVSPFFVYLGGMLYTELQLRALTEKIDRIPRYPSAQLNNRNFADFKNGGHSWHWEFEYKTEDDMNEVIAFYQDILPKSGWDSSPTGDGAYIYRSSDLSMLLFQDNSKPGNETFFGLSIISRHFNTLFDLRYSE